MKLKTTLRITATSIPIMAVQTTTKMKPSLGWVGQLQLKDMHY